MTSRVPSATNLLLGQVVREVSDHDLGLGGDAVNRGATLATLAGTSLSLAALGLLVSAGLIGDVLERLNLSSGTSLLSGSSALLVCLLLLRNVSRLVC